MNICDSEPISTYVSMLNNINCSAKDVQSSKGSTECTPAHAHTEIRLRTHIAIHMHMYIFRLRFNLIFGNFTFALLFSAISNLFFSCVCFIVSFFFWFLSFTSASRSLFSFAYVLRVLVCVRFTKLSLICTKMGCKVA